MATTKVNILFALLAGHTLAEAVTLTAPDVIRRWLEGNRRYSHFTFNPKNEEFSWITFPDIPTDEWTKTLICKARKHDAGVPGKAVIAEATIKEGFWIHNKRTKQNQLFYEHLIIDKLYDEYLRSFIDVKRIYDGMAYFNGKIYKEHELRNVLYDNWANQSLLNDFDSQIYIALASMLFSENRIIADRKWIENEVRYAFLRAFPTELAEHSYKLVSMSDFANEQISELKFDLSGPVPHSSLIFNFIENVLYWIK